MEETLKLRVRFLLLKTKISTINSIPPASKGRKGGLSENLRFCCALLMLEGVERGYLSVLNFQGIWLVLAYAGNDDGRKFLLDGEVTINTITENVPLEEVFQRCDSNGLTTESVEERLVIFGHNKLEEKKESKVLKFLGFMWNPLSWVMEAATIMVIALADGEMTIGPNLIETIKEIWFPRLQHFLQESRLWLIMFISYVFGEDVSFGGVFRCTTGLADQFGDGKTQQLGPKLWEIVGEQQGILKITGIGEHAHIRTFTEHSTKILAEESYSIGPTGSRTQVAGFKVQSANHYTIEPICWYLP
ncbi:hypothetical protein JHK82_039917 [Glycine max]|uniref:ATPase 7, plasma membrane-type n=1 Tax=Glycine soja TaxID=3848 RepID=A0A0B2QYY8_GLYSO|nr:hypothetical protein JHK86_040115 [Glycine max]KAG4965722.1 hypothetical protein JHK85_040697 [Glycine max]KAG5110694.1 hypothetical protein JHK82_039917 [Glycine max]KAG5121988.1 hypothetical protein JHK84_040328 [Glycine max]KHN25204.1 ATPase 7, plasma membrane-type [Glycine soja]